MLVRIETDEWYPVYVISTDTCGRERDVPASTLERWDKTRRLFLEMQEEMEEYYGPWDKPKPE